MLTVLFLLQFDKPSTQENCHEYSLFGPALVSAWKIILSPLVAITSSGVTLTIPNGDTVHE